MSGTGTTGAVGDNVDILGKNAIRVSGLSTTGDPVTLNTGKIATVTFTATENITAENARIEVKTEALPDYDTLKDNDVNLTGNIIDVTVKSSEAKGYTVSMGADKQVASGQIVEIDLTFFRRDQIWFAEKDEKSCATELYSLASFSPRKGENIRKGYLQGHFGAIPFIGGDGLWQE